MSFENPGVLYWQPGFLATFKMKGDTNGWRFLVTLDTQTCTKRLTGETIVSGWTLPALQTCVKEMSTHSLQPVPPAEHTGTADGRPWWL